MYWSGGTFSPICPFTAPSKVLRLEHKGRTCLPCACQDEHGRGLGRDGGQLMSTGYRGSAGRRCWNMLAIREDNGSAHDKPTGKPASKPPGTAHSAEDLHRAPRRSWRRDASILPGQRGSRVPGDGPAWLTSASANLSAKASVGKWASRDSASSGGFLFGVGCPRRADRPSWTTSAGFTWPSRTGRVFASMTNAATSPGAFLAFCALRWIGGEGKAPPDLAIGPAADRASPSCCSPSTPRSGAGPPRSESGSSQRGPPGSITWGAYLTRAVENSGSPRREDSSPEWRRWVVDSGFSPNR